MKLYSVTQSATNYSLESNTYVYIVYADTVDEAVEQVKNTEDDDELNDYNNYSYDQVVEIVPNAHPQRVYSSNY